MPEARLAQLAAQGRWGELGRILEVMGRAEEALDAYRRAGQAEDAARMEQQVRSPRSGTPSSPLFVARSLVGRGEGEQALSTLMALRPEDPDYGAACRMAIRVAEDADRLDFDLDHFLSPFLLGRGHLSHGPGDVPSLDLMSRLYARHGMKESAVSALRAALVVSPDRAELRQRLADLAGPTVAPASFESLLDSDLAFHAPARAAGEAPAFADLPPLPDLPSLDSLDPLEATALGARPDPGPPTEPPVAVDPVESATISQDRPVLPSPLTCDPSRLSVGDLVADRYTVQGRLGRGGMGVVLHVEDTMLGEDVAMKLVFREGGVREEDRERFKSEMRICRKLVHPSVVRVYEFGLWRGNLFLTMELMRGMDLDGVLRKQGGPLPVVLSLRLLIQACDGLAAAHAMGVVHRDIKPPNLFVLEDGQTLKVMDFGIAQPRSVDHALTQTGAVVGSPAYMAPERLRGKPAVPASDLYSLGCVAYQMLCGVHPFRATELAALFVQHLQALPTPPRRVRPSIPVDVERLILRLLEKDPADRFRTALELRRALTSAWRAALDQPKG